MATERARKLAQTDHWQELMRLRDSQREQRRSAIQVVRGDELDRKSTRLNSSHIPLSRMPSSA